MEVQNQPPSFDAAQVAAMQKKIALENKIKSGVNWFFWIAGLSIVNSVLYLLGLTLTFVVGLGVTQIIDGFLSGMASELGQSGILVRLFGFIIDIFIAGIFVVFGVLGRKKHRWAIILGMVLYAMDTIILLPFQAFFAAAFHLLALFGLWTGLKAIKEIQALDGANIDLAFK